MPSTEPVKRGLSHSEQGLTHGDDLRLFGRSLLYEPWRPPGCLIVGQTVNLFWKLSISGRRAKNQKT